MRGLYYTKKNSSIVSRDRKINEVQNLKGMYVSST